MLTTQKLFLGIFIFIFAIFSINAIDAQTLIAGKIYDSNFSNVIVNASVKVTCRHISLNTISLDDGTYAVRFNEGNCNMGDIVQVVSSKGSLTGSGSGTIIECNNGSNCSESYFSIVNLNLRPGESSPHPYTGGFYLCGNGVCDSGETYLTCPRDCRNLTTNSTNTTVPIVKPVTNFDDSKAQTFDSSNISENKTSSNDSLLGITGAAIGSANSIRVFFAGIFLVILIGGVISFTVVRKRRYDQRLSRAVKDITSRAEAETEVEASSVL
jgi:hypothetical protein